MARALADIITELNSVYSPQRDSYNAQLGTLDPQMEAEQQGLQAQKQDSFQQITDQANRRGLFYSGLPIAEEQRYTGQQFLPAVANLRAKYSAQKFGLQDAIAKVTADQYNQAYGVRQGELENEEKAREFDRQLAAQQAAEAANRAAAARASGGGGGGVSFGGGPVAARATGGVGAAAKPAGPSYDSDQTTWFNLASSLRNQGLNSWGAVAKAIEARYGKIPTGSAADNALHELFGRNGQGGTVSLINQATGFKH